MGMTRQERVDSHKKQERLQVKDGTPHSSDLKEGVPELRRTPEGIVVEYVKHKGVLHKKVLDREGEGVGSKLSKNGYTTIGGGLIMQWGSLSHGSTTTTLTFPIAFPNNVFMCVVSAADSSISDTAESCGTDNLTTASVNVVGYRNNSGNTVGEVHWIAIGH